MTRELLLELFLRVMPGIGIGILFLFFLPRRSIESRIFTYILLFILFRDTMTPLGLWRFGAEGGLWIRFIEEPMLLLILGIISFFCVVAIQFFEPDLGELVVWVKGRPQAGLLWGILGAGLVVLPFYLLNRPVPLPERGGAVETGMLLPLLVLTLLGNFLEETLFRGYFQGYMEKHGNSLHAAIASGLLFGFGHTFLAITVTDVGYPLLIFVIYEGLVAAFVRRRHGVLPATLTHGLAIFLLASGLL